MGLFSEIPPEQLRDAVIHESFNTRDIHVAAMLCCDPAVKPASEPFAKSYTEAGQQKVEFFFEKNPRCTQLIGEYYAMKEGTWPALVRVDFHNRNRLLDIAKGRPVERMTRRGMQLYIEPANYPPNHLTRKVAGLCGKLSFQHLDLLTLLLGTAGIKFKYQITDTAAALFFDESPEVTRVVEAFTNRERFVEGNADFLAFRIAALKYREDIRNNLHRVPHYQIIRRDGRVFFLPAGKPIEESLGELNHANRSPR